MRSGHHNVPLLITPFLKAMIIPLNFERYPLIMQNSIKQKQLGLLGILVAIAVTTTMDVNGLGALSAFPLILITLIFYFFNKPAKNELGLSWGKASDYLIALSYPALITLMTVLIAIMLFGESIEFSEEKAVYINLIAGIIIGPLMVLITEEGFFRGWLWATLKKAGLTDQNTLWLTTAAFIIWHISAVTTGGSYGLPIQQVPVYLVNVLLMGLVWGHLRSVTDSVIVASVCHAVWNAIIYGFFGFGEKVGALGFEQTAWIGPEVGYLGIVLNGFFYLGLRKRYPIS